MIRLAFLTMMPLALGFAAVPGGLSNLSARAEAIAVVEILFTDYTATAADGPAYVESKVRKTVKGGLRVGQRFRFGASAWVGPSFQQGERRVVFLESVPAGHSYYGKARWASLDAGKIDLSIGLDALQRCTVEALTDYLKSIEASRGALKAEFSLAKTSRKDLTLSIQIVNTGRQDLSIESETMSWSWEAGGVRRPLRVDWSATNEKKVLTIAPGATVSASTLLPPSEVDGASAITVSFANLAAVFPTTTWIGMQSSQIALED